MKRSPASPVPIAVLVTATLALLSLSYSVFGSSL